MKAIREIEKRYCSLALTLTVAAATICLMLGFTPLAKGLVLGALFSIANFIIMGETLPLRIGHSRRRSTGISMVLLLGRYAMLAIPLAIAIRLPQFNLASTICSIFAVQFVIVLEHLANQIQSKFRKPQVF